jgi:hypothetical protein
VDVRLLNVAKPATAACVSVPPNVESVGLSKNAIVTLLVNPVTLLPDFDIASTVGDGEKEVVIFPLVGC